MRISKYVILVVLVLISSIFVSAEKLDYGGSGDKVEIEESFGDILPIITSVEMPSLESFTIKTDYGSTTQHQYIHFGNSVDAIQAPKVKYLKSDNGDVGSFIEILGGTSTTEAFFEYEAVFDAGLESTKSTSNNLVDMEDVKIKLFADEYIIIDSDIDTGLSKVTLLLATSSISDTVFEGESKIYTIGLNKYEVIVSSISSSPQTIIMTVNGEDIGKLEEDGYVKLADNTIIGVRDIVTSDGAVRDLANIYIGAKTIELEDSYNDNSFEQGLSIDGSNIQEGFVLIKGTYSSDIFKLTNIKYRGTNPSRIYIPQGSKLSFGMTNIEALLGNWDILYNGFKAVTETIIEFKTANKEFYSLSFENQNKKTYNVPFYHEIGSLGDGIDDTHIKESASSTTFSISTGDYFFLSTGSSKNDKTFALQYNSIDKNNNQITLNEMLEGGIVQLTAIYTLSTTDGTLGEGKIDVDGNQFDFYIGDSTGNNLSIDLDKDGTIEADSVDIIVNGGGIIDPGTSNTPGTTYSIQITTKASSFEEATSDETVTFQLTGGTTAGIPTGGFSNIVINGVDDTYSGMSNYGAEYILSDVVGSNSEGNLVINYPTEQRFADVNIELLQTSPESSSKEETTTTCSDGLQNGDEAGLDCGGSCSPCEPINCNNGVQDGDEAGLDCGGSCNNLCEQEQNQTKETTTPVESSQCPFGCLFTDSEEKTICLKVGEIIEKKYCSSPSNLVSQKKNGETCSLSTECLSNKCEENKCGLDTKPSVAAINILLVLLLIFVVFKVHSIIRVKKPPL